MQQSDPEERADVSRSTAPGESAGPGVRRYSVTAFLVLLVLVIIVFAFLQSLPGGTLIEAILLTLVLFAGVRAVGARTRTLVIAAMLAIPAVAGKWIDVYWPGRLPPGSFLWPGIACGIFVAAQLLRFVLSAPRVNHEVLCAGISVYLLMGLLWTFGYVLIGTLVPNAFAFSVGPGRSLVGFEAAYFSFVTLTTCGYGDIVPVAHVARMMAMLEAMTGTFYVAILIARLVSLYSWEESREARDL
jgi:hypothetical protein